MHAVTMEFYSLNLDDLNELQVILTNTAVLLWVKKILVHYMWETL